METIVFSLLGLIVLGAVIGCSSPAGLDIRNVAARAMEHRAGYGRATGGHPGDEVGELMEALNATQRELRAARVQLELSRQQPFPQGKDGGPWVAGRRAGRTRSTTRSRRSAGGRVDQRRAAAAICVRTRRGLQPEPDPGAGQAGALITRQIAEFTAPQQPRRNCSTSILWCAATCNS